MLSLQEDRQRLIEVTAISPLDQLQNEFLQALRKNLGNHLTEHKDCSDKCPERRNLESEIGIIVAAIDFKQK